MNTVPRQRTASDVAHLESDNDYLHSEVERLNHELAIVKADRGRLQVENALLLGRASENLVKATRMETIVRQVSAGLVDALVGVTREREADRDVRRRVQEERLGVGGDDPPLGGPTPVGVPRASYEPLRTDAVARAAEQLAPTRTQVARVDHTLAEKDPRMPPVQYGGRPTDEERMQQLAEQIEDKKES